MEKMSHDEYVAMVSDRLLFAGIASETDDLPIGAVRRHWAQEALASKDTEIERYESRCRLRIIEACHRLARLAPPSDNTVANG